MSNSQPLSPIQPITMRALILPAYGAGLVVTEKPVPQPGPGEVLVRMAASPINPSDLVFLQGTYGTRKTLPVVPGLEGSGVVVRAGPGLLPRLWLGRRVACAAPDDRDGTWADYMVTRAEYCLPLLPWVSLEQGAMMIVNPLTALTLLDIAREEGHRAAVSAGAAGALGRMILRLGLRWHYPLIHVVRRQAQVDLLRDLGAPHVLNSEEPGFDEQLHALSHRLGATIALDPVAGELTGRMLAAMPDGSRALVYGNLTAEPCQVDAWQLVFHGKRLDGFWLTRYNAQVNQLKRLRLGYAVQRLLASDLRTAVQERVSLEDVGSGLERYRQGMTQGKVLIKPSRAP